MRKIVRELQKVFPDVVVEVTAGSHYRLRLGNGRFVVVSAKLRATVKFMQNVRANVRREMKTAGETRKEQ